jgi:hypothetical protein
VTYGRSQSSLQTLGVRLFVSLLEHLVDIGSEEFWGSGRGVTGGVGVAECSTCLSCQLRMHACSVSLLDRDCR